MPILPLMSALLLYLFCRRSMAAMNAFVHAAIVWGVLVLVGTELLSLGHLVTLRGLAAAWVIVALILAGALWRTRRATPVVRSSAVLPAWALLPALATLGVTLVIALAAPPNSTDALTYHLARVAQWLQGHSVAPYATSVTRQIFMPPWAEYLILHFQVLAGGSDRFASLVEWLAFAGCLVLGAGIARRLGADARGVGLSVVLMVTLPTAIVEASSTQTDLVAAFWAAALAWVAVAEPEPGPVRHSLLAGGALGLALASKGTAYVICPPLAALVVWRRFRSAGARAAAVQAGTMAAVALLLVLPSYARNLRTFHHPLGPPAARADLGNVTHGLGTLASNVVRNATIHLRTPEPSWNEKLARGVERAHAWVGLDAQDPNTTYPGEAFGVPLISTYEGRMGNPLQFLLLGAGVVLLWLRPARPLGRQYAMAVLAGALLFCWVFRWQHWHGRLHTPFFILAAPLLGALLQPLTPGWRSPALAACLWVGSLPWLIANQMRPLVNLPETSLTYASPSVLTVPRNQQYFGKEIADVYLRVIGDLARAGCNDLALVGGEETRVYPLFPFARAQGLDLRLHYVFVQNETRNLEEDPRACALFVAEEQPAGWRPGPPYGALELRWSVERFALWQVPQGARDRASAGEVTAHAR